MLLDPNDLRAYAARDWAAPERLARQARALQPVSHKVALGIELYEAARNTQPGWPSDEVRKGDLECHIRLRQALRRAPHVGTR